MVWRKRSIRHPKGFLIQARKNEGSNSSYNFIFCHIGYIQILLSAGAIQRDIIQFSEVGGGFINNVKVPPCFCQETINPPIHIMWVRGGGLLLNHFVPISPVSRKSWVMPDMQSIWKVFILQLNIHSLLQSQLMMIFAINYPWSVWWRILQTAHWQPKVIGCSVILVMDGITAHALGLHCHILIMVKHSTVVSENLMEQILCRLWNIILYTWLN